MRPVHPERDFIVPVEPSSEPIPAHVLIYMFADLLVAPERRITSGTALPWRRAKVSTSELACLLASVSVWDLRRAGAIAAIVRRDWLGRRRILLTPGTTPTGRSELRSKIAFHSTGLRMRKVLVQATGIGGGAGAIVAMTERDALKFGLLRAARRPGMAPRAVFERVDAAASLAAGTSMEWLGFAATEPALHTLLEAEATRALRLASSARA